MVELRAAKAKMDAAPVIVRSLKRQVDTECRICDLVEKDFKAMQSSGPGGYQPSIEELKMLFIDCQELRYRCTDIENTLAQAIGAAETIIKLAGQEHKDTSGLASAIKIYKLTKVKAREVEEILTHRQLALDYLNNPHLGVDKMDLNSLKLVDKCISNCLDPSFSSNLADLVLKRKVQLLSQLEKRPSDHTTNNLINSKI